MPFRDVMEWVHVDTVDQGRRYKELTYDLVGVAAGRRILDVGCGIGSDAVAMARQVGESGEVVGVDPSVGMIAEARRRAGGTGLSVRFEVAGAAALPFPDNSFDGCRADRVFQHESDPEAALAELIRVGRPGAPIVVSDPDLGSTVLDLPDRFVAREVMAFLSDLNPNPWSGRRLPGMFRRAGLTDILVIAEFQRLSPTDLKEQLRLPQALQMMQTQVLITAEEGRSFLAELESRTAEGTFLCGTSFFIVAGHKAIRSNQEP